MYNITLEKAADIVQYYAALGESDRNQKNTDVDLFCVFYDYFELDERRAQFFAQLCGFGVCVY